RHAPILGADWVDIAASRLGRRTPRADLGRPERSDRTRRRQGAASLAARPARRTLARAAERQSVRLRWLFAALSHSELRQTRRGRRQHGRLSRTTVKTDRIQAA